MVECLGFLSYASDLVNLVIFLIIEDFQFSMLMHSVRSIILYIACIMSFVWRSTATSTTAPGISDTGLLVIRIVITVILGIGTLYGFLIITTFRRYGVAIDKAWKQRIDRWIEEAPGNRGSFAQPALDNPQYPSITYASEDGSTMYGQPTYKSSPYYQPSFGDAHGGYARDTCGPTPASNIYVPPPRPYLRPSHLPHSPSSTDTVFRVNTFFNQSSNSSMTMSWLFSWVHRLSALIYR